MGLLSRLFRRREDSAATACAPPQVTILQGSVGLEVVGESHYQGFLRRLVGAQQGRVRLPVVATLRPEPNNPYDSNAVAVDIDGQPVGHLPAEVAKVYQPAVMSLMRRLDTPVALHGVIVGESLLGVWLNHDPTDFGQQAPQRAGRATFTPRTGWSTAVVTDDDDDTYDLSWYDRLPEDDWEAVAELQRLLSTERDPLDRHFMFAEIETRLYRGREVQTNLEQYDRACAAHDAEMDTMRAAFINKWGGVPMLVTYQQMAIRQQKKGDWAASRWWAERGLSLYGDAALREDAVLDLRKRLDRAQAKLQAAETAPSRPPRSRQPTTTPAAASPADGEAVIEVLTCIDCGGSFERVRVRGRKPKLCPTCRTGVETA